MDINALAALVRVICYVLILAPGIFLAAWLWTARQWALLAVVLFAGLWVFGSLHFALFRATWLATYYTTPVVVGLCGSVWVLLIRNLQARWRR